MGNFIADVRKNSISSAYSRALGYGTTKKSIHAEMALLRVLKRNRRDILRTGGKGMVMVIISLPDGGGSAIPCLDCNHILKKLLPNIKIISYRHGVIQSKPSFPSTIVQTKKTWGSRT